MKTFISLEISNNDAPKVSITNYFKLIEINYFKLIEINYFKLIEINYFKLIEINYFKLIEINYFKLIEINYFKIIEINYFKLIEINFKISISFSNMRLNCKPIKSSTLKEPISQMNMNYCKLSSFLKIVFF